MTPKEKAEELVREMCLNDCTVENIKLAKQYALIAVDEIIEAIKIADNITFMYVIDYYKYVKQEIEKL